VNSRWHEKRKSATDATAALVELLEDDSVDARRLVIGYLDAKGQLARAFQALAEDLWFDPAPIERIKSQLETAMQELYPELPAKYKLVRGYGRVHQLLFAFLSQRVGQEVSSDELRVLTGDAIHTERRARDLRELGLLLETYDNGGVTVYVLRDAIPSSSQGARNLASGNVRDDKSLSEAEREAFLSLISRDPDLP
jgi:hypothetical protein